MNPSRSFTMSNLGWHLPAFIDKHPKLVSPSLHLAQDMVRFQWAQVEAVYGPSLPPLTVDDLLGNNKNPAKIRLTLQPYISILHLRYPLDQYLIRLKKSGLRGEASNAVEENAQEKPTRKRKTPIPARRKSSSSSTASIIPSITSGSTPASIVC